MKKKPTKIPTKFEQFLEEINTAILRGFEHLAEANQHRCEAERSLTAAREQLVAISGRMPYVRRMIQRLKENQKEPE